MNHPKCFSYIPKGVSRRTKAQCLCRPRRKARRDQVEATLRFGLLKFAEDRAMMNHHRALASCLGMIFSENRFTLFRIMP
jgi:hypothetical protein